MSSFVKFLYDDQNLTDDTNYFFHLFDKCESGNICLELLASSGVRWLMTLFGLIANSSLIWITIRNKKKFNGATNLLLAFGAFCEFFYLLGYSIPFILAITGRNFISLHNCFLLIAVPIFGAISSLLISLFVGIDRLISVVFPFNKVKLDTPFLLLCGFVVFAYSGYVLIYGYLVVSHNPNLPAVCGISEIYYPRNIQTALVRNNLLINSATLLIYLALWASLRREFQKTVISDNARATRRIFVAIFAIMLMVVSMWLLTMMLYVFLGSIQNNIFQWFILPVITSGLTIVAASSNAPLLYFFNVDYREALKRELKGIRKCTMQIVRKREMNVVTNGANGGHGWMATSADAGAVTN